MIKSFPYLTFTGRVKSIICVCFIACIALCGCHPKVPPYPYKDENVLNQKAQEISTKLENYIEAWFRGEVPATLPPKLLPMGADPRFKRYHLVRYEDIHSNLQWIVRSAEKVNVQAMRHSFPDPHTTYLVLFYLFAPFGHRVVIDGDYPYARFFDIQMTPPFNPSNYYYNGFVGVGEVPIVDADIKPLPDHVNPFLPGADRLAKNRHYQVVYTMAMGDGVKRNPLAFTPPYRAPGNHRYGGGIVYQGPWGDPEWVRQESGPVVKELAHGRGEWGTGSLWIRYYAPDSKYWPSGGVTLPKVWYETQDGRRYFIQADQSEADAVINKRAKADTSGPKEPHFKTSKANFGWEKQFGIFRAGLTGLALKYNWYTKQYIRELDIGVAGRAENMLGAGGLEPSATTCVYINYLERDMALGKGKIAVMTGKMPTFPKTRRSNPIMQKGQMRYWSVTAYTSNGVEFVGGPVHSIMDEDVVLDAQRHYVIVFSRPENRPANATAANGVTWVNWGPIGEVSWIVRWLSVAPEWSFTVTPDEKFLPWSKATWTGSTYDPKLIAQNTRTGIMGEYLPNIHYLSKKDFDGLGKNVRFENIPVWKR